MNRRTFLQQSSLIVPGLSVAGLLNLKSRELSAATTSSQSFSLSVVTDEPEQALSIIQETLSRVDMKNKNIRYTEYVLHGDHIADIAYTNAGQLIDFHKTQDHLSAELREIVKRLEFPRSCQNPLFAHFSCDEGLQKPAGVRIFKDNELIMEKSFPVHTEAIHLPGLHGKVVLEMSADHSVRFAESSCTHKTCMTMGAVSQAGQNLVCIPNQVAVTITGTDISGTDSITY